MWLIVTYEPTALFSLRYSNATTAGAKSLLVPSPYTIKMALTVAAIRLEGKEWARANFTWIRELSPIRILPSQFAVVNRCFLKFQSKKSEKSAKPRLESGEIDPAYTAPIGYAPTVGFREYVHLQGEMQIAFPIDGLTKGQYAHLCRLLPQINTFGKRGSLFQFIGCSEEEKLTEEFSVLMEPGQFPPERTLQPLDDMGEKLTFEKIDITETSTRMDKKDRLSKPTFISLRPRRFSAAWAAYEREKTT